METGNTTAKSIVGFVSASQSDVEYYSKSSFPRRANENEIYNTRKLPVLRCRKRYYYPMGHVARRNGKFKKATCTWTP